VKTKRMKYGYAVTDDNGELHRVERAKTGFFWVLPDGRERGPNTFKNIKNGIDLWSKHRQQDKPGSLEQKYVALLEAAKALVQDGEKLLDDPHARWCERGPGAIRAPISIAMVTPHLR
jgi:hypothetical protein